MVSDYIYAAISAVMLSLTFSISLCGNEWRPKF